MVFGKRMRLSLDPPRGLCHYMGLAFDQICRDIPSKLAI
jgi:hypothetical protein